MVFVPLSTMVTTWMLRLVFFSPYLVVKNQLAALVYSPAQASTLRVARHLLVEGRTISPDRSRGLKYSWYNMIALVSVQFIALNKLNFYVDVCNNL